VSISSFSVLRRLRVRVYNVQVVSMIKECVFYGTGAFYSICKTRSVSCGIPHLA